MNQPVNSPHCYFDANMSSGELVDLGDATVSIFARRCPVKNGANEDAAAVILVEPGKVVLAVADGAGGARGGEQASNLALRELSSSVRDSNLSGNGLREAILNGFERANENIISMGIGAATTLAVVSVEEDGVRSYHAGDSAILIVGQKGSLKLQTTCHSPVGYALESGYLDEAEAMEHSERHLVSNVVGSPTMKIELGPGIKLAPRDTLLLASDGLFDNLHLHEVVELVRKGSLAAATKSLAGDTLKSMQAPENGQPSKADDLTFLLFRLKVPRGRK
ncbi:MAG: protein phosphatase 2C domain-containing protein [Planctomycetota bacterium]